MMKLVPIVCVFASILAGPAFGQATPAPPLATGPAVANMPISRAAWLAGCWEGEGLGGHLQECWSTPSGTQMSGHFTLSQNGRPVFHEFLLLEEHAGALRMRIKHFNPDMTGWEDKDETVDFSFVAASANVLEFSALKIEREGRNRLTMTLRMRQSDGTTRDEILRFRRVR